MRSFCSLSENAHPFDHDGGHNFIRNSHQMLRECALPMPALWQIIRYLSPSVILYRDRKHFCSPRHPCCLARPAIRSFIQLRLVCHAFNSMCRIVFPQYTIEETWWPKMWNPSDRHWLESVVMAKHFQGRYRHCSVLAGYCGYSEGCSVAYDTGTPFGCDKAKMPIVVIKVLEDEEAYTSECDSYMAIRRVIRADLSSGFPEMLDCGDFAFIERVDSQYPRTHVVHYLVLQYLGPTLHDILMDSAYTRFTSRMTMAVAIQLVSQFLCSSINDVRVHALLHDYTASSPSSYTFRQFNSQRRETSKFLSPSFPS
ncbi:hypothetical protein SISNIDRAFT_268321 [Sistotremastrum niveocremeum HHB9708]|uniref:Uncharacterized protein n=1 Tax=Sistotremastrum niveocremeum HHB9708 TaxID=1314777 RepID=A0A164NZ63_9AGAM|nr:hypothetical protein SISNIDRAFT_268321 [Sistotremastrum niveocremeum HHB9708]